MSIYIFFIPIYSVLISECTLFAVVWHMQSQRQTILSEILNCNSSGINPSLTSEKSEDVIEQQIEDRLNEIIAAFKRQIPMIGLFLSKTKEGELKVTARVELMKLIPAFKQRFFQKKEELPGKELRKSIERLLDDLWAHVKGRLLAVGLGVGLLLGILEAIIFSFLSQ